jgi:hypothetical protein
MNTGKYKILNFKLLFSMIISILAFFFVFSQPTFGNNQELLWLYSIICELLMYPVIIIIFLITYITGGHIHNISPFVMFISFIISWTTIFYILIQIISRFKRNVSK